MPRRGDDFDGVPSFDISAARRSTSPLEAMISRDALVSFFDATRRLRGDGKAHFDIDDTCRWSYFFVDLSRPKLKPLADHLQQLGYEARGYLEPDLASANPVYFLRVDRVERHTVDSLDARNGELHELAVRFGVQDYDGMDVGEVMGFGNQASGREQAREGVDDWGRAPPIYIGRAPCSTSSLPA